MIEDEGGLEKLLHGRKIMIVFLEHPGTEGQRDDHQPGVNALASHPPIIIV